MAFGQYFEMTPLATTTYRSLIDFRLSTASLQLDSLSAQQPKNDARLLLANYYDCIRIFVWEDKSLFEELKSQREARIDWLEGANYESPYIKYALAEIYLQWAFCRMKFGEYVGAVSDIKKAYKLLEQNSQLFPDFIANKKNLGILHALVGTIPDEFRWGVKMLGMDGTIEQGGSELESLLKETDSTFLFRDEALVYYAYFLLHLNNKPEESWQVLQSSGLNPNRSLAANFVFANVAMHTGRNEKAIEFLERKPQGNAYMDFPYLDFMTGMAKLHRLDSGAARHIETFVEHPTIRHYKKEAYQKLAWYRLIFLGPRAYVETMAICKKEGLAATDEDKTAQREARNRQIPNEKLLQARLLFDGGYHERAYEQLTSDTLATFTDPQHQIEYYYRLARICDGLRKEVEAIHYYNMTIREGQFESSYFAANSALQLGKIFENQGQHQLAVQYYSNCLQMEPDEYRNSLHQKAKAGINRISTNTAN